jgi:serine/threonine-protein kinase OSR1/STK39
MERKPSVSADLKIEKKNYPLLASDYKLLEEIGKGVSAVVYRAKCIPLNEFIAIKALDLDRCNSNLVSL